VPEGVLVVGGTGLIGRPVARRLLADGFLVRLLVRSTADARASLGADVDYVQGNVQDAESLDRAARGCVGAHVREGWLSKGVHGGLRGVAPMVRQHRLPGGT
jgi:uncharacterized protein YbjT (DUF2867 family)